MHDVVIVGAGPVGVVLGILLGQRGRDVVVVERFPSPYPLPRAVHFDHEVARLLQSCGLGAELEAISEPAEVYEWRNGAGDTLLRFGRVGVSASGWPESSMFNQPALEELLARRLEALPTVRVERGVEVVGLSQDADAVRLQVAGGDEVVARYAVGCDGANSTVRTRLDVPIHDFGFFYDWLIVDVVLDEPRVFDPINLQICDPARPTTVVSGGPGRRRWEFMRLPDESIDELRDADVAWRLLEPWDVTPANAAMERHAVYTFQARWAERWREGRAFLAGDAAHLMPPFAGQGMCSGVRDAANLAWKLDLVLDGRAPDRLLDTYETERMPNAAAVVQFSMELGKVICVPDPAEAAARDEAMMASVVEDRLADVPPLPRIEAGLVSTTEAAGGGSVQGRVVAGGGGVGGARRCDDVVGAGWRLLVAHGEPGATLALDRETVEWFEGLGGSVLTVATEGAPDLVDVDGTYADWFAAHGVDAVLQRPDFVVYGAGEIGGLLDGLRTELEGAG